MRILSWQAQQTLAQKSEPGREPAPRLTPARPPHVWASASLPPLSSGPRPFQRHSAFHRGEANLRPQPSLFRASGVLSFLVRKKSLQEPLQKEQREGDRRLGRGSKQASPVPAGCRHLPSARPQQVQGLAVFRLQPQVAGGPRGQGAGSELRRQHHRAPWGSVLESSGLRHPF